MTSNRDIAALKLTPASEIEPAARGSDRADWGPWYLDADQFVLWTAAGGYRYEVDLKDATTSAQVLDWITQIAHKEWARDAGTRNAIIAGLVTALDDVLDLQAHLCPSGQSRWLSRSAIRKLVLSKADLDHGGNSSDS